MKKIYLFGLFMLGFFFASNAQIIIPTTNELVLPQYAYYGGVAGAISNRMPVACRLTLTGLLPGGTYRYFTGMSNNPTAATQTPGNLYRINNSESNNGFGHITGFAVTKAINSTEINNDEMLTSNTSRHGRFNADGSGSYTGWFACVPVGQVTQQPIGSDVYFYVQLNDGNTGLTLFQSFRTTSTIKLLNYSSVPGDATGCTGLIGTSDVGDEKMVAIYDNTAATGRPLYCTFTENNNNGGALNEGNLWTNPVLYPAVDGVSGSWAAIIPNTLVGGIKAINFLNISDGSAVILSNAPAANTSADGSWNGVSTTNPTGDSSRPITINSVAGSALPITLLSFNGQVTKEGVRLFWETSQEINNKFFEINRAGSDGTFRKIGHMDAVSVPTLTNRYQLVDANPVAGINYYQLKQVDVDGRYATFKTIAVRFGDALNTMRLIQSGNSELVVSVSVAEGKRGQMVYTDMVGNILYNQPVTLREGANTIRIPVVAQRGNMAVISLVVNGERMNLKVLR
jgi:hypothetical protein